MKQPSNKSFTSEFELPETLFIDETLRRNNLPNKTRRFEIFLLATQNLRDNAKPNLERDGRIIAYAPIFISGDYASELIGDLRTKYDKWARAQLVPVPKLLYIPRISDGKREFVIDKDMYRVLNS